MKVDLLVRGIAQLVTPEGQGPKKGAQMRQLRVIERAAIAISGGRFSWVGPESDWKGESSTTVDAGGRAVVPGLIDPHTHAVWAGDRLNDFEARARGATYESLLKAGGGIRSTVLATVAASQEELVALALPRIEMLLRSGATTIEIKSGYGIEPKAEIAILKTIRTLGASTKARVVPTLLIHIPPEDQSRRAPYLKQVCLELIPEVSRRKLATSVDVFVEKEAWSAREAECLLAAARGHGLATKVHAEQFHRVGGLELGIAMGALSVDHLEALSPAQMAHFAGSSTVATILPGVSLHLGIAPAPGRQLIDAGAAVAVGTDLNPGSSPLFSTAAALALAIRMNGLTPHEALIAGTVNAASAAGLTDVGRIEEGLCADFLVLQGTDWRDLVYTLGANPVRDVWTSGQGIETKSEGTS